MRYILIPLAVVIVGFISIILLLKQGLILTHMDERTPWGIWEAAYIFCTGLSAGSFVISVLGILGVEQFKKISRIAVVQAILLLMVAPVFLFVSMGRPEKFYNIYLHPNPTSAISWGAYLLAIYPLICIIYAYYQMRRDFGNNLLPKETIARHDQLARIWGLVGVPAAIMVHGYTGVLLGFIKARVLWNTPLMPVLFLTSAVVSGLGLLILNVVILDKFTHIKNEQKIVRSLAKMMLYVLIFDLVLLSFEMLTGMYHPGKHFKAWEVLIAGPYSWQFLGGELLMGSLIPLLLLLNTDRGHIFRIILASILIMGGIFIMRCNIILGGQVIQAYGGGLSKYFPSLLEWVAMAGIFAVSSALYMLSSKYLPLMPRERGN